MVSRTDVIIALMAYNKFGINTDQNLDSRGQSLMLYQGREVSFTRLFVRLYTQIRETTLKSHLRDVLTNSQFGLSKH